MKNFEITEILKPETRVLAFVAHPDDFEDYWGGTMLQLLEQGNVRAENIFVVVATDGAAGGRATHVDARSLAALRRREQEISLIKLGLPVENLTRWDFADGTLDAKNPQLLERAVHAIRNLKPDVVLTHNSEARVLHLPTGDYYLHRDHRELGSVVLDAVYPFSRDLLFFSHHAETGNGSHSVAKVLLSESATPNVFVDIAGHLDAKLDLFSHHTSQFVSREKQKHYYEKLHGDADGNLFEQFEYVEIFN